ncbi:hypothetical protein [Streptomyces kaempferi]|uniref:Uncharacterized protein n=2 Tax=Streptomyces kaempferi TaxID=333725 RepID=A0ABW3XVN2_9ACTN
MRRALAEYAAGTLLLPCITRNSEVGNRRGRSVFATDDLWLRADVRRTQDAVRSMSALCEILLDAYARGDIHHYARMITTAQRDALTTQHHSDSNGTVSATALPGLTAKEHAQ